MHDSFNETLYNGENIDPNLSCNSWYSNDIFISTQPIFSAGGALRFSSDTSNGYISTRNGLDLSENNGVFSIRFFSKRLASITSVTATRMCKFVV